MHQFIQGKRGIHFEATEGLEHDHLADLGQLLAEATGSRLLATQPLTNWPAALAAIEELARGGQAVVILDEFQWIAGATTDIGSQLNRWWRTTGHELPIILILSGSEVSFFEREVLTGSMFGRRTGQQQLLPFGYRDAALFFPGWSPEDIIRAYAPLTAPNPDRTKQTRYELVDGYLRFYFRFMLPYESRLKSNADAERYLTETVMPNLDHFVSKPAFEEICQAFMRAEENAVAAGSWWGNVRLGGRNQTREVDAIEIDSNGVVTAIGSCKWTTEQVGLAEESLLAEIEPLIPKTSAVTVHYFFGRNGFDPALEQLAADQPQKVRLVSPPQLF